jgi:hypothetical protein
VDEFNCTHETMDDVETPMDGFFDTEQWLLDTGCSLPVTRPTNDNASKGPAGQA